MLIPQGVVLILWPAAQKPPVAKSGPLMIQVSESRSTQMNKKSLKTSTDKQVKDGGQLLHPRG